MFCRTIVPNPKTAISPIFSTFDQVCWERIAFDVTVDVVAVLIRFNGKRLESTLVDMAVPDHVVILLPASHVGDGQLLHEPPQIAILFRR